MLKFVNLNKLGNLCIRGAWLVASICLIQSLLLFFSIWRTYQDRVDTAYPTAYDFWGTLVVPGLFSFLQSVAGMIFYFCLLYALGSILKSLQSWLKPAAKASEIDDGTIEFEDDVTYESLD